MALRGSRAGKGARRLAIIKEVLVPGGYGRSIEVQAGQYLAVVDVAGQQVADFIAFKPNDWTEFLSVSHTRAALLRLNVTTGDRLVTNWRNPMFEIVHDTVGTHDIITQMCDSRRYKLDYGVDDHRSCRSNFVEALADYGIEEWRMPDPFNIFQNAPIKPDRTFGNEVPTSKPGDRIILKALMDALVGVSACPQDLNPCNGWEITDIKLLLADDLESVI